MESIIEPRLAVYQGGAEHYIVPGGGAIGLRLRPGDRFQLIDVEGRQPCELVAYSPDGSDGLAGLYTEGDAARTIRRTTRYGESIGTLVAELNKRGFHCARAKALQLFGDDAQAGARVDLFADRELLCIISAPGELMCVDAHNPPTELGVIVRRAQLDEVTSPPLPDPLADPRIDMRVERATARSYEVKAGEFIQVIDVAGRQSSDFLAFDKHQLERGIERGLDATTTRTLLGAAPPGPSLYAKFYDMDMEGLVEVVRDTVGRHDSFALACYPRYYEDIGYPGHANCSENFNQALNAFGVRPRVGWPAINFFYNTAIDNRNVLYFDESWSRPGDYVLLRALTDLVCATSACPDDVTPANGWIPTDIHVRVYPSNKMFSRGVAFRMTPDSEPRLTKETAFHVRTSALTRNFSEFRGYWLPASYTNHGAIDEYWACRERAAVIDLSALRKFEVTGPDAEVLLQHVLSCDVRRMATGHVRYAIMCYPHGGLLDHGTLFRLGADNFRWVGTSDYGGIWLRKQCEEHGWRAWVKSSTDQLHNLAVQGPESRDILKVLTWTTPHQPRLEELEWYRFTIGRVGQHNGIPIIVSRTGTTGELGYEVWCHPKHAVGVWDAIWDAGRPADLTPMGLEALEVLRIEAGIARAEREFAEEDVDPFEAGVSHCVDLDRKKDDFVGREALAERRKLPRRRLVGLVVSGNEPANHGDGVYVGRSQVGVITSGCRSPLLRKNIALCRLDVAYTAVGTDLEVGKLDGHQKRLSATVCEFPFYDPGRKRMRASADG
jgi:aminomethyltransferase